VALPFPVSHLGENNENNIPRQKMGGIEKKKKSKTFFHTQRKIKKKTFESNPPRLKLVVLIL
jgi:hypothetical protein